MQIGKRFSFQPSSSNNTRAEPLVAQSSYSRSIFTTRGFSVTDGEDKKQQLKKKLTANHLPCSYAWPLAVATYLLMACLVYPNLRREKVCSFTFVGYTLIFIRGKPRGGTNVCLWIIDGGCMWFWTLFFVPVDRLFTHSWLNPLNCCCSKIVIENRFMWFCTVSKFLKLCFVFNCVHFLFLFSLEELILEKNELQELPNCLQKLTNLKTLNVAYNQLDRLPAFMVNSSNMRPVGLFVSLNYAMNV